jgi:hypothetical protein
VTLLYALADDYCEMREKFFDSCRSAPATGVKPFQHKSTADRGLLDIEAVDVELVVVFRVSDRSLQDFLDVAGDAAVRKV